MTEIHMEVITDKQLMESDCGNVQSLARAIWSVPNDIIPLNSPIVGIFRDELRRQTEVYFGCKKK